jgi:hypothetical protein
MNRPSVIKKKILSKVKDTKSNTLEEPNNDDQGFIDDGSKRITITSVKKTRGKFDIIDGGKPLKNKT